MPEPRRCQHCGITLVYGRGDHVRRDGGYVCVVCFSATPTERRRRRAEVEQQRAVQSPVNGGRVARAGRIPEADQAVTGAPGEAPAPDADRTRRWRGAVAAEEARRSAREGSSSQGSSSPGTGKPAEPPRELTREEFDEMFPDEDEP